MDSIACNVVILPNKSLANKAITASKQLAERRALFTLEDGVFYPHISIYMLQLKIVDLPKVKQLLSDIAKDAQSQSLVAQRYGQAKQFLDVGYEKSDMLGGLQNKVVSVLNPLRDGMRAKDVERMQEASGLTLENYRRYGWNSIGELYRPHLTLTRFTEEQDIDSLALPNVTDFNGTFPEMGLFEMGDNGTCVRKIATFQFGAQ